MHATGAWVEHSGPRRSSSPPRTGLEVVQRTFRGTERVMHDRSAGANSHIQEMSCFLDALRAAARTGAQLVLPPDYVGILLSEEVYTLLSRLEARSFRPTGSDEAPSEFGEPATGPGDALEQPTTPCDSAMFGRSNEMPHAPSVEQLISDWLKFHVSGLAAPDRYQYSVAHLKAFFNDERRLGRVGDDVMVKDLTPELQARFRAWRAASGVGGHTISRDLAALRGALSWAWKHQRIARPPFIADVPFHLRGRPRDRVLSLEEIAGIIESLRRPARSRASDSVHCD